MIKRYFVKYSYQDKNQPLIRRHVNDEITLTVDSTTDWYAFLEKLPDYNTHVHMDMCIDFMMELPL